MDSVPPARTHSRLPVAISLIAERDRFDPGGAGLVHRVGGNLLRDAAANGDLAGGIGASTGLAGIAENRLFDLLRLNAGAIDGGFGCDRTHIGGGLRGERPSEFADGRARGRENVNGIHNSWMS